MTLAPIGPNGSQRFTSDGGLRTGDVRALVNPPSLTLEGPLAGPDYHVKPIKGMANLYHVTVTLHEARGPYRQEGDFRLAHGSRSTGTLQCDEPDVLRLPFLTTEQTSPDPTGTPEALLSTTFGTVDMLGVIELSGAAPWLGRATSITDPTIVAVAGYPPATRPLRMTCLRVARFAGTEYLMAGFFTQNGATSTLQAITNITTNPPTIAYVPTGGDNIIDMVQLPDGSLMVWNNGRITMVDTTVAPAAAVWSDHRAALGPAGYFVGIQALGGGRPMVYAVVSDSYGFSGTVRGKLVAISLDGWTVQDVTTGLPWVTFATATRDGLMLCDQTNHVFLNGRQVIPMNWNKDLPINTDFRVICRGHHTDKQRFWWKGNQIKSGAATDTFWMECHFALLDEEGAPISMITSATASIAVDGQTIGGANLPYFPVSRRLVEYSGTSWFMQKQTPPGEMGYNQRKQAGQSAGSGDQFVSPASTTWPKMQIPGLEGCPGVLVKITAPPNRHNAAGHDAAGGYTTGASVRWEDLISGVGATFTERGPAERRPVREFSLNRSWGYGIQPKCTLTQQAGGTDPTRFTPNGFPVTFEYIFYKDGMGNLLPSQYRNLDATRVLRAAR